MNTVRETARGVREAFTGDMERDLSELGLSFNEVWEASGDALANIIEHHPGGIDPSFISTLLRNMFAEGVTVGVKFERERRT